MQCRYRLKGADAAQVEIGFDSGGFFFARIRLLESGQLLSETKPGKGLSSLDDLKQFVLPWIDLSPDVLRALKEAQQLWEKQQQLPFQLLTQPYQWGSSELRLRSRASLSFRTLTDLLAHCQMGLQQDWNRNTSPALAQSLQQHRVPKVPTWKEAKDLRLYMGFVQQLVRLYQDQSTGAGHHDQWWRQVYLKQLYTQKQNPLDVPRATLGGAVQQLLHVKQADFSEARQQQLEDLQHKLGWAGLNWDLEQLLQLEAKATSLLSMLNQNLHPQQQDVLTEQMIWLHPKSGNDAEQELFLGLLPLLADEQGQAAMLDIKADVWGQRVAWKRYCLLMIALADWAMAYPAPSQAEEVLGNKASRLAYDPWIKFLELYQGLFRLTTKGREAFWRFLWMGKPQRAEGLLLKKALFQAAESCSLPYLSSKQVYSGWVSFLEETAALSNRPDQHLLASRCTSAKDRMAQPSRYIAKLQLLGFSWTNLTFPNLEYQGFVDNLLHTGPLADKKRLLELRQEALLYDTLEQLAIRTYGDAAPMRCPFSNERFKCQCQKGGCRILRSLRQLPNTKECLLTDRLELTA